MKRARKLLENAAARLDLPEDLAAGLPKLELTGFSKLTLTQHRGVLEYTGEAVTVALSEGRVRITGSGLSISLMNRGFLILSGALRGIELIPGGAA